MKYTAVNRCNIFSTKHISVSDLQSTAQCENERPASCKQDITEGSNHSGGEAPCPVWRALHRCRELTGIDGPYCDVTAMMMMLL